MNIKRISQVATFLTVSVTAIAGAYMYEKGQPTSDFFEYYGNVMIQREFHFPERLRLYTFGVSHVGPLEMKFINRLWCKPHDGTELPYQLLATRYKEFDSYEFINITPPGIALPITSDRPIQSIGRVDEKVIREESFKYISWNMREIRPYQDSDCYIDAEATTYSLIFGLPKTLRFSGDVFEYYTSLREISEFIEPYSIWSDREDTDNAGITTNVIE